MQVTYRLADEDYRALARFLLYNTARGRDKVRRQIVGMITLSLAGAVIVYTIQRDQVLAILFGGFCVVLMNLMRGHSVRMQIERIQRTITPQDDPEKRPPGTLKLTPEGLEAETRKGAGKIPWSNVTQVARDASHLFIIVGKANAFAVPKREFESPEAFEAFHEQAVEYHFEARKPKDSQ